MFDLEIALLNKIMIKNWNHTLAIIQMTDARIIYLGAYAPTALTFLCEVSANPGLKSRAGCYS